MIKVKWYLIIIFDKENTPLFYACFNKNYDMIKWMLENGANPNAKCTNG